MPLPTQLISDATARMPRAGFGGPFRSAGGAVYMLMLHPNPTIFKATNAAEGPWTRVGSWDNTLEARGAGVAQVGDVLHVAGTEPNGTLRYATFDMATDTWTATTLLHSLTNGTAAGETTCEIVVKPNGDIVIGYRGADFVSMGAAFLRQVYARRVGGTWTTNTSIDAGGTTTVSYNISRMVLGTGGRVHVYYKNNSNHSLLARTIQNDYTLSTAITVDGAVSGAADVLSSPGFSYDDGGIRRIRIALRDGSDRASIARNVENGTTGAIENEIAAPSVIPDVSTHTIWENNWNAAASVVLYETQHHLVYVDNARTGIFHDRNTGTGWGTDTTLVTGAFNDITANYFQRGGNHVIGYVYTDNTNTWYSELVLAAGAAATPVALTGTAVGTGTASGTVSLVTVAPLSGTAAGTGTLSGTVAAPVALTGTAAGTGTASGAISTTEAATPQALTGTAAGTGSLSGTVQTAAPLTGSAPGTGTLSGTALALALLSGTAAGTGTASGTITTSETATPVALTGTAAGTGAASGTLAAGAPLSASAAGTGTAAGTATVTASLGGTASGVGTAAGTLTAGALLAGTATGTGTAAGTITTTTAPTPVALTGTAAGTGTASGTFVVYVVLSGTAAGAGTATGNVTTGTVQPLSGTASGTSTAAGTATARVVLSGTAAGTGTTAGAATVYSFVYLAATANGAGTLSGDPLLHYWASGTAAGVGTLAGVIRAPEAGTVTGGLPQSRYHRTTDASPWTPGGTESHRTGRSAAHVTRGPAPVITRR